MEEQNQLAIDHFMQTGMYITLSLTHSFQLPPNSGAVIGRFYVCMYVQYVCRIGLCARNYARVMVGMVLT